MAFVRTRCPCSEVIHTPPSFHEFYLAFDGRGWQTARVPSEETRLQVVFGHLHEGVLVEDGTRHVKFANKAFTDIFVPGLDPELMVGGDCDEAAIQTSVMFKHPQEWLTATRAIVAGQISISNDEWETADGRWLQRDYLPRVKEDEVFEHIWLYRDVTRQHVNPDPVGVDSFSSERTGLRDWASAIKRLGDRAESLGIITQGAMVFVKVLDVDQLNSEFGYDGGDRLITSVLEELRGEFGEGNVERLKGTVFGILTTETDPTLLIERTRKVLDPTRPVGDHFVSLHTQIGIATTLTVDDFASGRDMFESARLAVRQSKVRHSDVVLDVAMRSYARVRTELTSRIDEILADNQFCLHYQPIVNMEDQRVLGFEALVRWVHPVRGVIPAFEFITAAEETGVIAKIDRWVIREACRQASLLLTEPGQTVAVNVSQKTSLAQHDYIGAVKSALAEFAIDPAQVVIEVTETSIAQDQAAFHELISALRGIGIKISIDDFGVGSSTLAILKDIPFDRLKLDRSFTADISEPRAQELIRVGVAIGEIFGSQVIAEGVETQEHMELLLDCGVQVGQGWHLGMPQPL